LKILCQAIEEEFLPMLTPGTKWSLAEEFHLEAVHPEEAKGMETLTESQET